MESHEYDGTAISVSIIYNVLVVGIRQLIRPWNAPCDWAEQRRLWLYRPMCEWQSLLHLYVGSGLLVVATNLQYTATITIL